MYVSYMFVVKIEPYLCSFNKFCAYVFMKEIEEGKESASKGREKLVETFIGT